MPVTFGAVGDIISVCLLVKDLVEALDKTRGSKAEYRSAQSELLILEGTLLEVDVLIKAHGSGSTPELRDICTKAEQAAARCKDLIRVFSDRVRKYKRTFEESHDQHVFRDVTTKIRWQVGEKDALEQFRGELERTTSSLRTLLVIASL